jgi:hypothetical protein
MRSTHSITITADVGCCLHQGSGFKSSLLCRVFAWHWSWTFTQEQDWAWRSNLWLSMLTLTSESTFSPNSPKTISTNYRLNQSTEPQKFLSVSENPMVTILSNNLGQAAKQSRSRVVFDKGDQLQVHCTNCWPKIGGKPWRRQMQKKWLKKMSKRDLPIFHASGGVSGNFK